MYTHFTASYFFFFRELTHTLPLLFSQTIIYMHFAIVIFKTIIYMHFAIVIFQTIIYMHFAIVIFQTIIYMHFTIVVFQSIIYMHFTIIIYSEYSLHALYNRYFMKVLFTCTLQLLFRHSVNYKHFKAAIFQSIYKHVQLLYLHALYNHYFSIVIFCSLYTFYMFKLSFKHTLKLSFSEYFNMNFKGLFFFLYILQLISAEYYCV